jgi:hypothetical protein
MASDLASARAASAASASAPSSSSGRQHPRLLTLSSALSASNSTGGRSKTCCGLTPRALVSKKKLRFVDAEAGVDLDLSYITDRLIAMGYPSRGLEALYRNPAAAVRSFMEGRHGGHYRIWNLCIERGYGAASLGLRCEVERYTWYDHTPPPLALMRPACDSMDVWLGADPLNVAVVHCKAGKGRTGTLLAAYLLHAEACAGGADEALDMFGWRRTRNGRGVTIPSQQRYVRYYGLQARALREAAAQAETAAATATAAGTTAAAATEGPAISSAAPLPGAATARLVSVAPDAHEPSASLLSLTLHRDKTRGLGFAVAPDLEGRVVVVSFTRYAAAAAAPSLSAAAAEPAPPPPPPPRPPPAGAPSRPSPLPSSSATSSGP